MNGTDGLITANHVVYTLVYSHISTTKHQATPFSLSNLSASASLPPLPSQTGRARVLVPLLLRWLHGPTWCRGPLRNLCMMLLLKLTQLLPTYWELTWC